jgi:hypothetical protein
MTGRPFWRGSGSALRFAALRIRLRAAFSGNSADVRCVWKVGTSGPGDGSHQSNCLQCRASFLTCLEQINIAPTLQLSQILPRHSATNGLLHGFNGYAGETSKEIPMFKGVVGLVTVLFVAGSAYAQEASHPGRAGLTPADVHAMTDARIGLVKAALQLTPDQTRYWPPIEQAIRERAEARVHRITQLRQLAEHAGRRDFDPVALMRGRAENLTERGANLKKLADAWQPLYQTLNPDQKERLRLLAMHVVREIRDAVRDRRMEMMELEEDEAD